MAVKHLLGPFNSNKYMIPSTNCNMAQYISMNLLSKHNSVKSSPFTVSMDNLRIAKIDLDRPMCSFMYTYVYFSLILKY